MNIPYAMKRCSKCGEWLVANNYNFKKKKNCKWGLYSQCKKCEKEYRESNKEHKKEYNKEYNKNNKEYKKEYNKEYNKNNKEYFKQYNENNKENKKEYNKEYYENNKEYFKQYNENNKEYLKQYNKQYYEENPEKFLNYNNKRRSKEMTQGRGINKIQWKECFKWFDWKCAYSDEKLQNNKTTNGRTIDHIVALDNGGLNEPWNVVPMRKGYNCSKKHRYDTLNWYMEQEYFDEERLQRIVEWQKYAYEKWDGEEFGELVLITDLI